MYILYKLEYTYISKYKRVHKNICMKASGSRMYCIAINLDKIDIYMKLNVNMENMYKMGIQVKMYESSKLGYTSISNGYK